MTDVSVSNGLDKTSEDGRDLPLQKLLDLWLSIPPLRRRWVLRELYYSEQRRVAGKTHRTPGRTVDEAIDDTRAARWLLRGISKAMDPNYDRPRSEDGAGTAVRP
jgi:hypothetical protein